MKQLVYNAKMGGVHVVEVPPPQLHLSGVLVQNAYSLISTGTERSTLSERQMNLVSKAAKRPELVREVVDSFKHDGLVDTYHKVMNRLDKPTALGYCSAGVVLETSRDIEDLQPGDRVACAGSGYASHAEVVCIPKNLCIPLPPDVSLQEAAFTTLGAIAMQGIRQAEVTVGDYVAVIGLGLVGLLTVQILQASGCQIIGLDINPEALEHARACGAHATMRADDRQVASLVTRWTGGCGADRVIITAASSSNHPVELAGSIARDRGVVVVVGDVHMDVPRSLYYAKELTLKLSRSYGPGRYDPTYEEQGADYPIGYIRWTEKRNMLAFLQLVATKKIRLTSMISHVFAIEEAHQAYAIITGKTEATYLAILLDYHQEAAMSAYADHASRVYLPSSKEASHSQDGHLQVSFVGAGEFAQHFLLPPLKHLHGLQLRGVSTARGLNAHTVARKFGFRFCTTDNAELLHDPETHCVFIATRHHLHAPLVVQALEQHKHVFVEKPLALSNAELEAIIAAYGQSRGELMVGFNRRFAPVLREAKHFFQPRQTPLVIHYRINAGFVPRTHWTQDPLEGGGRILGEVCHFVDTILYLTDAKPMTVYAETITSSNTDMVAADNVTITMKLSDGSLGIITYVALGESSIGKERIEIFGDNAVFILNDFKTAEFVQKNHKPKRLKVRSKGHREEVKAFIEALQAHGPAPAAFNSLVLTTLTTLTIQDSLSQKRPVDISSPHFDL